MRASNYLISTVKETPADAEIISHQLMLRAGMIRKLASGLYSWLPIGLRVLKKVENIVRNEMNKAGGLEVLMPAVQPAELWEESGRWDKYGPELLRMNDRHDRVFCFGPTHEEVITDIIRREIRSYKQLPANFYQIQTKFRDEIRPRFGVMRAREFIMKDAYSFHIDKKSLEETYQLMHQTYCNIFSRVGLDYRAVMADTGNIGGSISHEFHVLADSGEDAIAFSDKGDYAANVELAPTMPAKNTKQATKKDMRLVDTEGKYSIDEVSQFLKISPKQTIKTLIVKGANDDLVVLLLRGDHEINPNKAEKLPQVASPFTLATPEQVYETAHCKPGSIGPVGLKIAIIADYGAAELSNFVCGANQEDKHLQNVNWKRDLPVPDTADLRNVVAGDPSPDGKGALLINRGIEVGHIFQLGTKYSHAMNATCLDKNGANSVMLMGCYGIGISRIVAAAIEQNHDQRGIIWPTAIAPFQVCLLPLNAHKSKRVKETAEKIYQDLVANNIDVLLDDRDERAGVLFADMDLIGIPYRLVISDRHLDSNAVEFKQRVKSEVQQIPIETLVDVLKSFDKKDAT